MTDTVSVKTSAEAPEGAPESAIEIRGLRKVYGASGKSAPKEALTGIDLTIPRGSVFGLLGPNGAGKSTMINIMAGLVRKTEGQVKIWGFDQDVNPRQSRAAIGVMPQELSVDPFFTPREALEVQAGLYGVPPRDRRTDEILELIGLTDKQNAYARTLSGGMRRRLLLGKALVHAPQILVLDEPTAGVDIELRQMLWNNVRELNRQGMTIILTTHYLEEAQEMCDEIAIIDRGTLVIRDSTESILARMDSKTLLVRAAGPVGSVALPEGVTREDRADGWLALGYKRSAMGAGALIAALQAGGVEILDLSTAEPDLEDAFLQLTAHNA
ncbi:ABC transporter ATP-binding protein [Pararhodobacter sp. CCB-MM2]|uniref:ABC transporter ATP-binding protein n=1 Tax=Pararhodobacter sp. CCB-MM2 TaxID=1786003 RepID=UPI0008353ACE|nr:ABC transporter ATP-binding protein [Pararhodobacter sp. CCB-MM2]